MGDEGLVKLNSPTRSLETWGAIVVSILIVIAFAIAFTLLQMGKIPDTPAMNSMVATLRDAFWAAVMFWIGSSMGSKSKDTQLAVQSQQLGASVPVSAISATKLTSP